jgi:ribosome-associated toxin RatA of RatAB toxin-antitoxin module
VSAPAEPVRRSHFLPRATPAEAYAVVADFAAYPRLFPEIVRAEVRQEAEATREGRPARRARVAFEAKVVIPVRYVLDLVCDDAAHTIDWTFVEGDVVTSSVGRWRFRGEDGGGVWMDYEASLEVKAPLPGFLLRKITDGLVSLSLPAMFAAIGREVAARAARAGGGR